MNLRDLEYLVALDKHRHFRKAAESCYVSQPGLSGQVKKLEEELGVQLIERTPRKVQFTAAGLEVVKRARRILAEVHELEETARSFDHPMKGAVHLGVIPTLAPYLIPLIIGEVKKAWPELEIYLHEIQTEYLLLQLEEGTLDLGILALPLEGSFQQSLLFEEPFLLTVPANHELAGLKKVNLKILKERELLLLGEGHCLRDQVLDICSRVEAHEKTYFRANSLEILRQMVSIGEGITLMPLLAIGYDNLLADLKVCYLPFEDPVPSREIVMIHRKSSARKLGFEALAELIRNKIKLVMQQKKNSIA